MRINMLLFKSGIKSLFQVKGLFSSNASANNFLKSNPDCGVIDVIGGNIKIIVVCANQKHIGGQYIPVKSIVVDDTKDIFSISKLGFNRFFKVCTGD